MAQLPGDILVPCHGYLPTLAGKRSYAHEMAVEDLLWGTNIPEKDPLREEIKQALQKNRFSALILDPFYETFAFAEPLKYYRKQGVIFKDPTVFFPVTDRRTRPQFICVPKRDKGFIYTG